MPITINGTTGIAGVDGSAGTPAVQGGDTNTGVFFPAADTIAFTEGGTEVVRINSSAQVEFLDGTASLPTITNSGDLNTGLYFPEADGVSVTTGGSERFRVGPSGQFGIGGATYGTSGQVLTSGGASAAPTWSAKGLTLLGTITTTSGTSLSLSGLNLTPYRQLFISINSVSSSSATDDLSFVDGAGNNILIMTDSNSATNVWNGIIIVALDSGAITVGGQSNTTTTYAAGTGDVGSGAAGAKTRFGRANISTASTSVGVSVQTGFDAGTVTVYGVA